MPQRGQKRRECILVFGGAVLYVFCLLWFTGALTSGYHLADDHEILLFHERFKEGIYSWETIFQKGLLSYFDGGLRFRPLYTTLRVLRTFLLGTNYIAWSVLIGMEIVFCIFFCYLVARNLGVGVIGSSLTAALVVTGEQGEIWWRLGPQEPTGLLLFLISMWLIQRFEQKGGWINGILAIFSAFLSAATKESFTLMLPILILFAIGYDFFVSGYSHFWKGIGHSLNKNKWIVAFFCLNFCVNLYVIIWKVGLLSIEYAGIDVNQGPTGYLRMLSRELAQDNMKIYALFILLSVFLILLDRPWKRKALLNGSLRRAGILLLAFFGIMAAELVLYAKSGMYGRYLVPFTAGVCLMNAVLFSEGVKKMAYRCIWLCGTFLIVVSLYRNAWMGGIQFEQQGDKLDAGFQLIEEEFSADQRIVTCMDMGGEYDYSFSHYAKIQMGMKNVYTWNEENGFSSLYLENEKEIDSLTEADCLILPENKGLSDFGLKEEAFLFLGNNGYGDIYKNTTGYQQSRR